MRKFILIVCCVFGCLPAQDALAAVKYKRFPRCPEGLVSAKTCECRAGNSGKYRFCHAGHYCHFDGTCRK